MISRAPRILFLPALVLGLGLPSSTLAAGLPDELKLEGPTVTDADLVVLKGRKDLKTLDLTSSNVTDAGLASLEGLAGLKTLYLTHTTIGDNGLAHLRNLTALEHLALGQNRVITDDGLVYLRNLHALEILNLGATRITNRGLRHLKPLRKLKALWIDENPEITDAALKDLKPFCGIDYLGLMGTGITPEAMERFKKDCPKPCHVSHSYQPRKTTPFDDHIRQIMKCVGRWPSGKPLIITLIEPVLTPTTPKRLVEKWTGHLALEAPGISHAYPIAQTPYHRVIRCLQRDSIVEHPKHVSIEIDRENLTGRVSYESWSGYSALGAPEFSFKTPLSCTKTDILGEMYEPDFWGLRDDACFQPPE